MDFPLFFLIILGMVVVTIIFRRKPTAIFVYLGIFGVLLFTGILDPILFQIDPGLVVVATPEQVNISVEPRPLEPAIVPVTQPVSNYTPMYLNESVLGTNSLSTGELLRT